MTRYTPLTAYGVQIATTSPFSKRAAAISWAEKNARVFPGMSIVQSTVRGFRTVWKDVGQMFEERS